MSSILHKLQKHWEEHPQLRFCQIIGNVLGKGDHYYVEDEEFEEKLDEYIERLEKEREEK